MDLALNNLQRLICHKTQQTKPNKPNDSSSVAIKPFCSEIKIRKILVENTTIIAHEINKLRLEIVETLHIPPQKNLDLIELTLKIATMLWNTFRPYF